MPTPPSPLVVIHLPHASTTIPGDCRAALKLSDELLRRELLEMTDRYTDELFSMTGPEIIAVRFPISRLVVNPERFLDDDREPMVKWGMGVIYTRTSDGREIRDPPTEAERGHLIETYYEPHHRVLTNAVATCLEAHGRALIVDAHSFPDKQLRWAKPVQGKLPAVCIGTDKHHTPSWLRRAAVDAYEAQGWEVLIDQPFDGALVPQEYYQRDRHVCSFMVELNRRLYMDDTTGERLPEFDDTLQRNLAALAQIIEAFRARPA